MRKIATAPTVTLAPPALPEQSASLQGMPVTPSPLGPGGGTGFTLSLPISPGRGYAPQLALFSGSGNGVFGLGWHTGAASIRRRTDRGVPTYQDSGAPTHRDNDSFLGPDGEVMAPELDADGNVKTTSVSSHNNGPLAATYTVTRYFPRIEGAFDRIEHWYAPIDANHRVWDFWLVHRANGELLCLGKTGQARIADPADTTRIAVWLAEESVSADGQHIYYSYADSLVTHMVDPAGRDVQANRYLTSVSYGNVTASADLFLWTSDTPLTVQSWLFTLLFDYGTPGPNNEKPPAFTTFNTGHWSAIRQDPFSHYDAGFEVRTHFLCRQVLMFHRFPDGLDAQATLVQRLLLEYDEGPACSRLTGAQLMAYEADSTVQLLPVLDIEWSSDFTPPADPSSWQLLDQPLTLPLNGSSAVRDPMPYWLTDLYGEGMSGLLYRDGQRWYYRPPIRDPRDNAASDAITYGPRESLPLVPTMQDGANASLMDINGDGRPEWVVSPPGGPAGYYAMRSDRTWSAFTPLAQLPTEVLEPYALFADLHGAGLADLMVINPRSVRYYINQSTDAQVSFSAPLTVMQDQDIVLPIPGRNPCEWVGFADVLGSGQAHLLSVRHDTVTCWPWLGKGRFGKPIVLVEQLGLSRNTFDPQRVSIVSIYGPGAPDLVYADIDGLKVFRNQSGNGFVTTPLVIAYPPGVHTGGLTQIRFAELSGRGTVSALLTRHFGPDLAARHWRLDLYAAGPAYQLTAVDNNCGARSELTWRSSIQDWVDEKVDDTHALPGLPAPSMVVGRLAQMDAITGEQGTTSAIYRRGVWDGRERESRGFGYVETHDAVSASATANAAVGVKPLLTRSWYHTGRADDAAPVGFYGQPFQDSLAFDIKLTLLTKPADHPAPWYDVSYAPEETAGWWMHRSLKGMLLRSEQFDGTQPVSAASVPFAVSCNRWQVRQVQQVSPKNAATVPVVLPMNLEQISYHYDQVMQDPLITQSVLMDSDAYGYALWTVDIAYPRRLNANDKNPYDRLPWPESGSDGTTTTPDLSWKSTFDSQQTTLRLTEDRYAANNVYATVPADANGYLSAWRLGVLTASRQNTLAYTNDQVPQGGLHVETLDWNITPASLLGPSKTRQLTAQTVIHYRDNSSFGMPGQLKLVDHTETAMLTQAELDSLSQTSPTAADLCKQGGYTCVQREFTTSSDPQEPDLWASAHEYLGYNDASAFWRPAYQQATQLKGADGKVPKVTYGWDAHYCALTSATDVYGNVVSGTIDPRFLTAWQIVDPNQNTHQVQQDALGRVVATSFFGTQSSADGTSVTSCGFSDLTTSPAPVHDTIDAALTRSQRPKQLQATTVVYDVMSQMGTVTSAQLDQATPLPSQAEAGSGWAKLLQLRFITPQGQIRSRGRSWAHSRQTIPDIPESVRTLLAAQPTAPIHSMTLVADTWFNSGYSQQVRAAVVYSDGYGRILRTATKSPNGQAFQRTATGGLEPDAGQQPPLKQAAANPCWAISEAVRHSQNGQIINTWPAHFLNSWEFVGYDAMPVLGYADTHYFDALGREVQVRTGLNAWRTTGYGPWFEIAQDENDLDSLIAAATLTMTNTDPEPAHGLPPVTTAVPTMVAALESAYGPNTVVLDSKAGLLRVSLGWCEPPKDNADYETIAFTNNKNLSGTIALKPDEKRLQLSVNANVDGTTPYYISRAAIQGMCLTYNAVYTQNAPVTSDYFYYTPSAEQTRTTTEGPLQTSWPTQWNGTQFGAFCLSIPVYRTDTTDSLPLNILRICNQEFYNYSDGTKWLWDRGQPVDTTAWPYPTNTLEVTVLPVKIYVLMIARNGTDRACWLNTTDISKSFTPFDLADAAIAVDYNDLQEFELYVGIVCLDGAGDIIAESWRRAFCRISGV